MNMKTVLRNMMVFNPLAVLACCGLGFLISHRVASISALSMFGFGLVIPWCSWFTRLVDRHVKVSYALAAIAWVIGAARIGWFLGRVTQ